MTTPHDFGNCSMDADNPDGTDRPGLRLLRELRLALEVHGPALGAATGCGARASVEHECPDRRQQGDAEQGSSAADERSQISPDNCTRRREAAKSLCSALRTFLLGWDEQCHESVSGEMAQPDFTCESDSLLAGGEVVSCLFGAFGPTDGQLRSILLQALPLLKSKTVRISVLGWLVRTVPTLLSGGDLVELVFEVELPPSGNDKGDGQKESKDRLSKPIAFDATEEVLNGMQTVIRSDIAFLVPVVNCLSSLLPSLSDHHANTVAKMCIASLKVAEAEELPDLIRCLFRSIRYVDGENDGTSHDTYDEEEPESEIDGTSQQHERVNDGNFVRASGKCIGAIEAIRAVRSEWNLIDSDERTAQNDTEIGVGSSSGSPWGANSSVFVSIIDVLCESLLFTYIDHSTTGVSGPLNCTRTGYISVIRDILDRQHTMSSGDKANLSSSDSDLPLSGLDAVAFVALLSSTTCNDEREEVEHVIDDWYSIGDFPFGPSATGLINLTLTSDAVSTRTKVALRSGLQNVCLGLLLCPLRCRRHSVDVSASAKFSRRAVGFVSSALESLSSDNQVWTEFIASIVDLSFVGSTVLEGQIRTSPRSKFVVHKVKRSGRSQRAGQFLLQCALRVAHSSLQILEILSKKSTYRDVVVRYRRDFVGHLFNSPSSVATADPAFLDLLCSVTVSIFFDPSGVDTNSSIKDGEELVSLVQRLLFVSPQPDGLHPRKPMTKDRLNGERLILQRMGLCLCRHLIRSHFMTESQCDTIWSWTMRIMRSQFSPTIGGRPNGEFPPALGLSGLLVLMNGCGIPASSPSSDDNTNNAPNDIPSRPSSDIYGMLKTIVARTGLIQLNAKVPTLIEKSGLSYSSFYATVPPFFAPHDKDSSKTRRMAFSIAGYMDSFFGLNGSGTKTLSVESIASVPSVATTFQWCFTLIDTYLKLGREASGGKWSPDGWLTASFILCNFLPDEANGGSASADCSSNNVIKALQHAYGCVAAIAMCAAVLKNAYGQYSALCLLDGENFQAKANALLRLVQYQLLVVYDLRRRCLSALLFIEKSTKLSRGSIAGNRGKRKKNGSKLDLKKRQRGSSDQSRRKKKKKAKSGGDRLIGNYDASRRIRYLESLNNSEKTDGDDGEAEEREDEKMPQGEDGVHLFDSQDANSQESSNDLGVWISSQCQSIRGFLSYQMSKPNFIPKKILCDCLFYEDDRATLDKFANTVVAEDPAEIFDEVSSHDLETSSLQIICLRREVLVHLAVLDQEGSAELPSRYNLSLVSTIEQLSPLLKILRSKGHRRCGDPGSFSDLPVLIPDDAPGDVFASDLRRLLSSYYDALASSIQSEPRAFAQVCDETSRESTSHLTAYSLYQRLSSLLSSCEDGVLASQIIDLVAIIVVQCQDSKTFEGTELSWKALTTVYAGCSASDVMSPEVSDRLLRRPPAFCHVIRRLRQDFVAKRDVVAALGVLDRFASTSTRLMKENALLRYLLLNHWALIMTKSCGSPFTEARKLVHSLRFYIEDMSKDLRPSSSSSSSRRTLRAKSSQQTKGKVLPPEDSATDIDIPNLTAKSFPVFFEGILYATIASFAVVEPRVNTGNVASPFKDIQLYSRLFRDMAQMYSESSKLFPQRTMGVVVRACAIVVSTCERQVLDCVTWRNKQPFCSRADGDSDYASSAFLQTLIDHMAFNCAGSAILFGDLVKSQAKQGRPAPSMAKDGSRKASDEEMYSDDSSTDDEIGVGGEEWAYGSHQKAVANLLLQGEKVIDALRVVCTSYNLRHPRVRMTKSELREMTYQDRLLSKANDEEKKEASSSEEKSWPGRQETQSAKAMLASAVRRKGKRRVTGDQTSSTHAEKNVKRRITPSLVSVRPQEAQQNLTAVLENNTEQVAYAKEKQEETNQEDHSDSDQSLKSDDSFGIDGGWGASEDDDDVKRTAYM